MEIEAWYTCIYCFEQNEVLIDVSGGTRQEYVEDCQVCCRPNLLMVEFDSKSQRYRIRAALE